MNEERRNKIIKDHPLLFPRYRHFECGDGWLDIIERLSDKLESIMQKQIDKEDHEIDFLVTSVDQIKEKYGKLRFYITLGSEEMYQSIDEAEKESAKTCEKCGKPGELIQGNWLSTLCNECRR